MLQQGEFLDDARRRDLVRSMALEEVAEVAQELRTDVQTAPFGSPLPVQGDSSTPRTLRPVTARGDPTTQDV